MRRITISGSQSVGKTTLIEDLFSRTPINQNFDLCNNTTRNALHKGKPINERGDNETQLLILSQHMNNYCVDRNTIYDRCALDGYVYTKWLWENKKVSTDIFMLSKRIFESLSYDTYFYIPPEEHVPLANDGERSVSREWQDEIHKRFLKAISYHMVSVVTLTGTRKERVNQFTKTIGENI